MRLVLVHGMSQQNKDPVALRASWEAALHAAWAREGLAPPSYTLDMPFYGKVLGDFVDALHGGGATVIARGETMPALSPTEEMTLREYSQVLGVSDADLRAEIGTEVVARGPANWEWVQAIARVLERVPGFGPLGLQFVAQVNAYLDRPHIRKAVDAIVEPALAGGPAVVVAHSLGSIVSYRLLTRLAERTSVPLLVTLGSPLGIGVVKQRLSPPALAMPQGVAAWINGTDQRDYVALHATLRPAYGEDVEDITDIHNPREDAHSITAYLAHPVIARTIHEALSGG